MRQLRLTILFLSLVTISRGQHVNFDLREIKFKGLEFTTTKGTIIKSLGQGKKTDTNYDCGFFTNDQPNGPYYQLVYADFNYIGSDKEKFYLQSVTFDNKGRTKIKYGDKELGGQTTKEEFAKIFGEKAKEHFDMYPDNDSLILYSKDADDGARFTFKDGRLLRFEYWTPC